MGEYNTSKPRNIRTWKRAVEMLFSRGCMFEVRAECQIKRDCYTCWAEWLRNKKDVLR